MESLPGELFGEIVDHCRLIDRFRISKIDRSFRSSTEAKVKRVCLSELERSFLDGDILSLIRSLKATTRFPGSVEVLIWMAHYSGFSELIVLIDHRIVIFYGGSYIEGIGNYAGIHGACLGGHLDLVKELVSKGVTPSDRYRGYSLDGALLSQKMKIMEGANNHQEFYFAMACRNGSPGLVDYLISIDEQDVRELSAGIFEACEMGHFDLVVKLIGRFKTQYPLIGLTSWVLKRSLYKAAAGSQDMIFNYLLLENPTVKDDPTWVNNFCNIACENATPDFVQRYVLSVPIDRWDLNQGMVAACRNGNLAVVTLLFESELGYKINRFDDFLIAGTENPKKNKKEIIELIIEKGRRAGHKFGLPTAHQA